MPKGKLPASFRDPSGFLFTRKGELYRQINKAYTNEYGLLMRSGLYEKLAKARLIIPHEEVDVQPLEPLLAFKVIMPGITALRSQIYPHSQPNPRGTAPARIGNDSRTAGD